MCEEAMGRVPTEIERLQAEAESYVTAVEAALERARESEAEVERLRNRTNVLQGQLDDSATEVERLRTDFLTVCSGRDFLREEVGRLRARGDQYKVLFEKTLAEWQAFQEKE